MPRIHFMKKEAGEGRGHQEDGVISHLHGTCYTKPCAVVTGGSQPAAGENCLAKVGRIVFWK